MIFRLFFVFIVILSFILPATLSDDVSGCGGFVDFKTNQKNSAVKVKLISNKGVVKYTSDIAPNNGYYFIPLYDHGEYVLKVDSPKGFVFEPEEVKINFDGVNDVCSKQEDVNFAFLGFGIFGRVTSPNSEIGPANIQLSLISGDSVVQKQITKPNGDFEFTKVLPGDYRIEAKHDHLLFKQNSIPVSVKDSNIQLDSSSNSIQIRGYPLEGKVSNQGKPVSDVSFAIFSNEVLPIDCDSKVIPAYVSKINKNFKLNFLCSKTSDKNGLFRFSYLPNGKYILIPYYETQGTKFDVSPNRLEINVKDEAVNILKNFEIGGFTVFGSVKNHLKAEDLIVPEKITLIGKDNGIVLNAQINKDGSFNVENIKSGKYSIKIVSSRYFFEDIEMDISPKSVTLPVLNPSKYEVCGVVKIKNDLNIEELKFGIMEFVDSKTSLQYFPFRVPRFCAMLSSGKYSAFIESPPQGPQFIPKSIEIMVKEPISNLVFEQFSAKVSGKILFKGPSSLDQIEMILSQGNRIISKKSFKPTKDILNFNFDDVSSGEYAITLGEELKQKYCWTKDSLSFAVSNANVDNLKFEQKGFVCKISLSHASELIIKSPSGKLLNIPKDSFGAEQFEKQCLDEFGIYEIQAKGCHIFSEETNNLFKFDTSQADKLGDILKLNAEKHMISGLIQTASNLTDLELKIHTQNGRRILKINDFKKNFINNQVIYSFSFYEKPNTKIKIEPLSGEVLFRPNVQEFILENDCFSLKNNFVGKRGIKIEGHVDKNVPEVDITIFDRSTHEVLCLTKTDNSGNYVCGPFDDDIRLRIEASKDGYHFKALDDKVGYFETFKLSSISGKFLSENNKNLNEVLVSISGGENNFRRNAVFNSNFRFENLQPGQYFIRFMKKEYDFEPQSEMIEIKDGEDIFRTIYGKKVAFSCIGKVAALNGEPETAVIVEAVGIRINENNEKKSNSIECLQIQEEAISDENGIYKVLGLSPQCIYEVRIKNDTNQHVRNAIPHKHQVIVNKEDVENINFIALYRGDSADVSVYVQTKAEFLKTLTVKLLRKGSKNEPVHEQKLTNNPFIFFPTQNIDQADYIIQVESDLSPAMLEESSTIVHSFKLSESFMHFRFVYSPKLRPEFQGNSFKNKIITDSSDSVDGFGSGTINPLLLGLLLTLGIVYFYYKQIFEFFTELSQASAKKSSSENDENSKKSKNKSKML